MVVIFGRCSEILYEDIGDIFVANIRHQNMSPTSKSLDHEILYGRSNLIDLLFIMVINTFKLVRAVFNSSLENPSPVKILFMTLWRPFVDVVTRPSLEFITLEVIILLTFKTDRSHRKKAKCPSPVISTAVTNNIFTLLK